MEQLIVDLVSYSQATLGHEAWKKTNLNALLKKLQVEMRNSISQKGAAITVERLPEITLMAQQVRQLFYSLLGNSLKFCREDASPEIKIWSEDTNAAQMSSLGADPSIRYVKITVCDNGMGIDTKYGDKIFEPFFRGYCVEKHPGSGLGLALVKKVVQNHGGFVDYQSDPGKGASFYLYLPIHPDQLN